MGDCCSTEAQVTVDPSAMPEKQERDGKAPLLNNDSAVDTGSFLNETESESMPKSRKIDIEQEWREAIQNSDNKKIRALFKAHYKQINFLKIKFDNGDKSLHNAVSQNNLKLARFLLLLKTDINAINENNGNTALHYAVQQQNSEMVKLLIRDPKCDINIANKENKFPLDIAKELNNDKIIAFLNEEHMVDNNSGPGGATSGIGGTTESEKRMTHQGDEPLFGIGSDTTKDFDDLETVDKDLKLNTNASVDAGVVGGVNVVSSDSDDETDGNAAVDMNEDEDTDTENGNGNGDGDVNNRRKKHVMKGFIEKKKLTGRQNYQKKWVIACEPYILWNGKEIDLKVDDVDNEDTTKKFEGCIDMKSIQKVTPKKSKNKTKQVKFIVTTKDENDEDPVEHTFRCESEHDRNKWVHALTKTLKAMHKNDKKPEKLETTETTDNAETKDQSATGGDDPIETTEQTEK